MSIASSELSFSFGKAETKSAKQLSSADDDDDGGGGVQFFSFLKSLSGVPDDNDTVVNAHVAG